MPRVGGVDGGLRIRVIVNTLSSHFEIKFLNRQWRKSSIFERDFLSVEDFQYDGRLGATAGVELSATFEYLRNLGRFSRKPLAVRSCIVTDGKA